MTGRLKRYVFSNAKMSRTTEYRRRLKAKTKSQGLALCERNAMRTDAVETPSNAHRVTPMSSVAESEKLVEASDAINCAIECENETNCQPVEVIEENASIEEDIPSKNLQSVQVVNDVSGIEKDRFDVVDMDIVVEGLREDEHEGTLKCGSVQIIEENAGFETEDAAFNNATKDTSKSSSSLFCETNNDETSVIPDIPAVCSDHIPNMQAGDRCSQKVTFISAVEKPVCPCTATTVGDILAMCLALGLRHSLTWEAQVDILKMVDSIFGKNVIPSSKYLYLKEINEDKATFDFHVACSNCGKYLGVRAGDAGCMLCNICDKDVDVTDPSNYFVSMPIETQLKKILDDPSVAELMLTYKFKRKKVNNDALEDIYDGSVYKGHSKPGGILHSKYNFSYSFFTDGCQFGKASQKTIWPIYVTFNELPPSKRGHYMCIAGLYVGNKDPNLSVFLQPFVENANRLSTVGFKWKHDGSEVESKLIPLFAVADSVARSNLLNMQAFGATFGCTYCYHKSIHTSRGQRYVISSTNFEERTIKSYKEDLSKAFLVCEHPDPLLRHHRGVKGPTPLAALHYFDVTANVPVDYMHNILLGVIKTHMELLFQTEKKKFWIGVVQNRIGVGHLHSAIDERLLKIKPPAFISRTPRSIKNRLNWKASEWLAWLLFYCLPCVIGILEDHQVVHLAMLSKATHLLLQKSVTVENVNEAHELFLSYSFLVQKYFGECEMVYNVHLLQHIAKGVLNFGPLFTHNAFMYEGENRYLLQLCKSAHCVAMQVAKKILIFNSFPSIAQRLLSSELSADFCYDLLVKRVKFFTRFGDLVLIGKGKVCDNLSLEEIECLAQLKVDWKCSLSYNKCIYKNVRYVCSKYYYGKQQKKNDAYLYTTSGELVLLKQIIHCNDNRIIFCIETIALQGEIINIKNPLVSRKKIVINEIQEIDGTRHVKCIVSDDIAGPCVFMNTVQSQYVSTVPYGAHTD